MVSSRRWSGSTVCSLITAAFSATPNRISSFLMRLGMGRKSAWKYTKIIYSMTT